MKKLILLILSCFLMWGLVRLTFFVTDGFFIWNIKSHLEPHPRWDEKEPDAEKKAVIDSLLKQKFTYFAKGHQAYVFLSEDGQWVLKFPKFQRYRLWPILKSLPLPKHFARKRATLVEEKKSELSWILDSWKITYQEFPELACLLYVQINPSSYFNGNIELIDKLGIHYKVPIHESTFLLQRRAEVFEAGLKKRVLSKDMAAANQMIVDLIALYKDEYQKGILEKDQHILRNMGYCDGKMMHIDPARFIKVEPSNDLVFKKEMQNKTNRLKIWLKNNFPDLVPKLEEEIAK